MADYSIRAPQTRYGLVAPPVPYQDSFATWDPASYRSPVDASGYRGLDFNWNNNGNMGGYGFQEGNLGGYGLQANGASIATPGLTGGVGIAAPAAVGQRSIMDSFLQQRNLDGTTSGGYGQAALGVLQGVGGLYLGMQQYNLAKDSLAASKEQFNRQFEVNKNLTNSRLEDRQRARVASNSSAYQSVGDYMNKNGVK